MFNPRLYLKKVAAEDFRSIRQTEVEFVPGLNIIIGKNGAGKTSFLKIIDDVLADGGDIELQFSKRTAVVQGQNEYLASFSPNPDIKGVERYHRPKFEYQVDGNKFWDPAFEIANVNDLIEKYENSFLVHNFLAHGLPGSLVFLNQELKGTVLLKDSGLISSHEIIRLFRENQNNAKDTLVHYLQAFILFSFGIDSSPLKVESPISILEFTERFNASVDNMADVLTHSLSELTSIENVRVNGTLKVQGSRATKVELPNLLFEFLSEGHWHKFSELSDGTQRIVYLVSQIRSLFAMDNVSALYLLEEPELGIHPHQLRKLMDFLKEQAETKQLILTTHSPQVLDILGPDDLDRIILCEYDNISGTQLRHMTDKEKEQAQSYLKDMFLSDFWRFTDFNSK